MHGLATLLSLGAALTLLAGEALSQGRRPGRPIRAASPTQPKDGEDWRLDPYTKNDPAVFAKVGYEFIGEFDWAENHTTAQIMATMPGSKLLAIETKHFKIASALGPRDLPRDREIRKRTLAEIDELRKVLPSIPRRVRTLDPWLIAHLYAARMEKLYDEFSERLGVTADDFPAHKDVKVKTQRWGKGPYLGRPEKFTLLMLESEAQMVRYLQTYLDRGEHQPVRHHYIDTEGFGYIVAAECHRGVLQEESHMHANIVFGMIQNLLDGYRALDLEGMPVWFREGLAHWYRRRVDPRKNNFSSFDDTKADKFEAWQWYAKVFNRTTHGIDPPAIEIYRWENTTDLDVNQHAFIWSRVDYLMTLEPEKFAKFVNYIEEFPLFNKGYSPEQTLKWYDMAYQEAFGFDAAEFDRKWKDYVLATYKDKQ